MKRKKRLFGILLILTALIIMQLPVSEADAATSASDFKMEGSTLIKYKGTESNVSIPDTVEVIGERAFENNLNVELVVVPNSVKRIEKYAFWGCENLDNVVLGKGLTEVGDYAFTNCKALNHMSVPSNIRSIGIQAFADCVSMTDIYIAPEVTHIHETAFDGCYKLQIHCETGSTAEKYAVDFYERQKNMPEYEEVGAYQPDNGTQNSQENQVGNTGQTEENIQPEDSISQPDIQQPDNSGAGNNEGTCIGTTSIVGNRAVILMNNTGMQVLDGQALMGSGNTESMTEEQLQEVNAAGSIPKYKIVDNTVIADQAYYKDQTLQQLTLPDGVSEIGLFSFARSGVEQICFPEGVREIRYGAFYHCNNLQTVALPTSIENVEPKAFLHTAYMDAFLNNKEDNFLISGNVLIAYQGTEKTITIPDGIKVIAGEAFAGQNSLQEIILPDSLQVVGEGAFEDCSNLKQIHLNDGLVKIKDRAFAGCDIQEITLPESVQELGIKAFDDAVEIHYSGEKSPQRTHEISAERLSNETYRNCKEEQNTAGVTVNGLEGAQATLEGAGRHYTLSVTESGKQQDMDKAYKRSFGVGVPDGMKLYDLELTDNSGIPITKLGKQFLQVSLPVPEVFQTQNIHVFTLDRNGQLEYVEGSRENVDGKDVFWFKTNYVSQIGMVGTGEAVKTETYAEQNSGIVSMSANPTQKSSVSPYKWIISVAALTIGLVCIFSKSEKI